tara:strand:+ start:477 stop:941 length:465 start_codon:yes stop_codon:yes gene_type:complete
MSILRATTYDNVLSHVDMLNVEKEFNENSTGDDLKFLKINPDGFELLPNFIDAFVKVNRVSKKTRPDAHFNNESGNVIQLTKGLTAARRYYTDNTALCSTTFISGYCKLIFKDIDLEIQSIPGRTVVFPAGLAHEYDSKAESLLLIANYEKDII